MNGVSGKFSAAYLVMCGEGRGGESVHQTGVD